MKAPGSNECARRRGYRYGWSSNKLEDLGGSERARLPDMYASDYTWSQKGKIQVRANAAAGGGGGGGGGAGVACTIGRACNVGVVS